MCRSVSLAVLGNSSTSGVDVVAVTVAIPGEAGPAGEVTSAKYDRIEPPGSISS